MKKLIYLVIAVMFLSALPEMSFAQSNDPFEQETLKANGNDKNKEKKVSRKKEEKKAEPVKPTTAPVKKQEVSKVKNEMTISNPCSQWLDLELVSVIGSKASQTITLSFKMVNHDVNKRLSVGGSLLAYDSEGNEHSKGYSSGTFETITDVTVSFSIDIPGKINPTKTTVMPVICFNIGDCRIEMRNVPIDWK